METTYLKGDKAEYTGRHINLYSGLFYEIKMLEGINAGQMKVVKDAPKEIHHTIEIKAGSFNPNV